MSVDYHNHTKYRNDTHKAQIKSMYECENNFFNFYIMTFPFKTFMGSNGFERSFNHSFILQLVSQQVHSLFQKQILHQVLCRASSFSLQNPQFLLRSSSSCLRLLLRLLATPICPSILPSIMCFRKQFLCKIWPLQLVILLFLVCSIFLFSFAISNTSSFLTHQSNLSSPSFPSNTL
jgi:hypothetical protein